MSTVPKGLSYDQASRLRLKYGFNELPEEKNKGLIKIALEVVREPMFLLLISCASLYLFMGDKLEGMVMLSTVFLIIAISFYQNYRSEKALEALKKMASPRVNVLRDNQWLKLPGRELVPGDVINVSEGDRLAADVMVLEAESLEMDESMLTGEAFAVKKGGSDLVLFAGTLVVKGRALAVVEKIGVHSKMGTIATSLIEKKDTRTLLQKEMAVFVRNVAVIGILLCVLIVVVYYSVRGNLLQAMLNGLAAAMAILPEEFPVVFTLFLAMGAWRLARINVLTRQPSVIEALGSASVFCSDKTGTITQNKMVVAMVFDGSKLTPATPQMDSGIQVIRCAAMASSTHTSDPMEKAMLTAYQQANLREDVEMTMVKEYPISEKLLATTRLFTTIERRIHGYSKGAPETIIELCGLVGEEKLLALNAVETMASQGFRVIGMANVNSGIDHIPESQKDLDFEFVGLMGLEDPVRPEVATAITSCKKAGIEVYMITGDHSLTAATIGNKIGLRSDNILTGAEMDQLDDAALKARLSECNIFARILPEQKLRLVTQFQQMGKVVAMTGDGVNDAPALKKADIGIAMGNKGTDVAREAARLVLLDDDFSSIVAGIRTGRRIYDNLQKAMSYIIAIHIPIIGLTLLPAFSATMPLLLLPLHIILMELIIDPVCSIAFEFEGEEKNIMSRPPRGNKASFLNRKQIAESIFHGLLLFLTTLITFQLSLTEGHNESASRMIAFSALLISNVFLIFSKLSNTVMVVEYLFQKKLVVWLLLAITIALISLFSLNDKIQQILHLQWAGWQHFQVALATSLIMLAILELIKLNKIRAMNRNCRA